MKIQYCSDLHLEFTENSTFLKNNPLQVVGEVLILAGDIIYLEESFFKHEFFDFCADNYVATYMICGNHEFYNGIELSDFQDSFCKSIRSNVYIVNNINTNISGINFIFSTLWTKILPEYSLGISSRLNDFHRIKYRDKPLSINAYNELFNHSFNFLENALSNNKPGKTIVVTHHAPSIFCNAEEHKNSTLNSAFVVDLSEFIKNNNVDYWIYGHTHRNVADFEINSTQILTNQLGYVRLSENKGFHSNKTINV